ncbi:MAG: peptidoglycan DD-metalloendopeptidase family protein, partial [Actinomycetota bacterium]|nr:peptidoglycan DD-metalloendopeptidase family protein [Actinomycetota bacterium]
QVREDRVQADLDAKQAELARTREQLRGERARLARLKAKLARSRVVLARRLRELYTADRPDIVTVILSARGFAELIEREEFMRRIGVQDRRVVTAVRVARNETESATKRLGALAIAQQKLTTIVLHRRDEVATVKSSLASKRSSYAGVRSRKQSALDSTRRSRHKLEEDVQAMQKEEGRIQSQLRGAGGGAAGPVRRGSGRLIWPVNGPITAPFCERRSWEACHPGMDIGASTGTPIRAADSGTVKIASSYGGYGNYTCIQHTGSLSTCYAHQSAFAVGAGQSVRQGQVIGYVGCTGTCFGAHLHFEVRVNGSVVDPLGYL